MVLVFARKNDQTLGSTYNRKQKLKSCSDFTSDTAKRNAILQDIPKKSDFDETLVSFSLKSVRFIYFSFVNKWLQYSFSRVPTVNTT